MKVLLISNYKPRTGGISGQVEILQRKLLEEGITTDIFNTKGTIPYRLSLIQKLRKVGKCYDVFHIHCCSGWGFLPAVIGIRAGRLLHKRIVLTYHGGGGEKFFAKHTHLVRHYLTKTDANIVLSGFLGKVFDKYDIPYSIIPNIIELDGSHFRKRNPIQPHFICIRTLDPLYNHFCILKAFQLVKQQLPNATLTLVGGGTIRTELEQFVKEQNIQDVTFCGRVDNSKIYEYLDKSDIMLSTPFVDNMPVSLLEGFNAGLLVISSDVGGVPYMITHGRNGLLIDSDNRQQLAEQMLYAIEHQQESQDMIHQAFQEVKSYTWTNVRPQILRLYSIQ